MAWTALISDHSPMGVSPAAFKMMTNEQMHVMCTSGIVKRASSSLQKKSISVTHEAITCLFGYLKSSCIIPCVDP